MKKVILIILLFLTVNMPNANAYKKANVTATIDELEVDDNDKQIIYFKNESDAELKNVAYLPKNARVKAEVILIQKEKRWHKSAFALLKLLSFVPEDSDEVIDLSKDDIYLAARKYVPINLPDAAGTGIELGATTAASVVLPGIDILYYFTKGAITREDHPNWFKAGVSEAYDNSIFWFIEKGRSIKLEENCEVQLKSMNDKKINKLIKKHLTNVNKI